jgi:F-type H+-transporting ATPase subunit alpha
VEEQVAIIYAGVHGFLDELPVNSVQEFEKEFFQFIHTQHPEILAEIKEKKALSEELTDRMDKVFSGFCKDFGAAFSIHQQGS